tara:strand:- start:1627 stop:2166 length:540 start_codon:yes stop_codon:yes gene_type:complete
LEGADCILLVGVDLKTELPLLNARLRSSFLRDDCSIRSVSLNCQVGYPVQTIGLGLADFQKVIQGRHAFCSSLIKATNPKIIISSSVFCSDSFGSDFFKKELDCLTKVSPIFSTALNILNLNASSVGALEIGRSRTLTQFKKFSNLILVGVDPEDLSSDVREVVAANGSGNISVISVSP